MVLLELYTKEKTENHIFFTMKIEETSFLGKKSTVIYDCIHPVGHNQNKFIYDGSYVYEKFLGLDDSINAILERDCEMYKIGML